MIRRGQRGAALVEYALGMAIIGALAIAGFRGATERAGIQVERKVNVGAPDLAPLAVVSTTTTVPGSTTPEQPSTTVASFPARVTMTGSSVRDRGNDWIATATITVVDVGTNAPVSQAVVTGRWSGATGGNTSCITQANGTCQLTKADLDRRHQGSTTLTILSAVHPTFTTVELPAPLVVNEP